MDTLGSQFFGKESWLADLVLLVISIVAGLLMSWVCFAFLKLYSKRKPSVLKEQMLQRLKRSTYLLLPLLLLYPVLSYLGLGFYAHKILEAFIIGNIAWLLISFLRAIEELVGKKFEGEGEHSAIDLNQPLKIYDEVMIEGEFGTLEDMTLTCVVLKTWDWRRLVILLNYLNDTPFFDWRFSSKGIINTDFIYVDYSFPVGELRIK